MILLDLAGTISAGLFVIAYYIQSIQFLYLITFLQQCLAGLYQPSFDSILPLTVHTDNELQKATTLSGLVWSTMATVGSALGGLLVSTMGCQNCFVIDGLTFLLSAIMLWMMDGEYNVSVTSTSIIKTTIQNDEDCGDIPITIKPSCSTSITTSSFASSFPSSAWEQLRIMTMEGTQYLYHHSFVGVLVFVKATAALSYGASDVLNVALSEQEEDVPSSSYGSSSGSNSSEKLGILFACMGFGCLLGPIVAASWQDLSTKPESVQRTCIVAFGIASMGYFGWGIHTSTPHSLSPDSSTHYYYYFYFIWMCLFAMIRSAGASIIWINSSLLLQKIVPSILLGRVMAVDYALALLAEAFSALMCGILMDHYSSSSSLDPVPTTSIFGTTDDRHHPIFVATVGHVSILLGCSSAFWMMVWAWYHYAGGGLAAIRRNPDGRLLSSPSSDHDKQRNVVAVEKDVSLAEESSEKSPLLS